LTTTTIDQLRHPQLRLDIKDDATTTL